MRRSQRGIITGSILGALLGASLAWAILGNTKEDEPLAIEKAGPGEWFKAGLAILTAARQLSDIIERNR